MPYIISSFRLHPRPTISINRVGRATSLFTLLTLQPHNTQPTLATFLLHRHYLPIT